MPTIFKQYPIKNDYVFYLPQYIFFSERYGINRLDLMDVNIYIEPSPHDCPSGDYRFNTLHCNGISDPELAWAIGLELINILRGLFTIFYGEEERSFFKIERMIDEASPAHTYPNSTLGHNINIKPQIYKSLRDNLIINLDYKERLLYEKNTKSNVFNSSLYLAQENIGVYLLLKYFSEPLTWSSLYKIMETLDTLEKNHDKGWKNTYTATDKRKFTNPANNYSLIGIDSRHGFKPDSMSANTSTAMTLIEAKNMFIESVKSYLNFKLNELRI